MRLIDADKLKEEVLKWLPSDPCGIQEKEMPFETDIVVSMMLTLEEAPSIDICFCRECKWEWTQKYPPHRMGLIHDENDYCSYGIRKGEDDEMS